MPSALLEQTRSIMRARFSQVITKRVYTLEFERSMEDNVELVGEIFAKLDSARKRRSVVCASPEVSVGGSVCVPVCRRLGLSRIV